MSGTPPPRAVAARGAGLALAVWTLVALAPNLLALPNWPWVAEQVRTPVDQATQVVAGGHVTAVLVSALLCVTLLAATGRASRYVLFSLPFVALVPLESLYILKYGQATNAVAFGVAAATNWTESAEFVGGVVLLALASSVALSAAGIGLFLLLRRNDIRWLHRSRWYTLAALAIIAAFAIRHDGGMSAFIAPIADSEGAKNAEVLRPIERSVERSYPLGLIARWNEYSERRRRVIDAAQRAIAFRFGAVSGDGAATVVLVIGESVRADHLGLNGYGRDTTPTLRRVPALLSFRHATAAAAATRESVPYMLTRRPLGVNAETLPPERSIISAFREAGFATWWISSQAPIGAIEDTTSAIAEEAAHKRFVNPAGYSRRATLDAATVPVLAEALSYASARRFVVVHLLQAHWDYRQRYPGAFDVYQPSGADGEIWSIYSKNRKEPIVNAYDNAIRYSDHVLSRLIETLRSTGQPSALVYMSDHGQTLFDGRCLTAGHAVPSRTVFEVPLLVWISPEFRDRFARKAAALERNSDRPVTVESIFPTLADLGGLRFAGAKQELSLANHEYVPGRRLVTLDTRNWIDFERDLPEIDCAARTGAVDPSKSVRTSAASADRGARSETR